MVSQATANVGPHHMPLILKPCSKARYHARGIPKMKYPMKFKIEPVPILRAARMTAEPMIYIVSKKVKASRTGQAERMRVAIGS